MQEAIRESNNEIANAQREMLNALRNDEISAEDQAYLHAHLAYSKALQAVAFALAHLADAALQKDQEHG